MSSLVGKTLTRCVVTELFQHQMDLPEVFTCHLDKLFRTGVDVFQKLVEVECVVLPRVGVKAEKPILNETCTWIGQFRTYSRNTVQSELFDTKSPE